MTVPSWNRRPVAKRTASYRGAAPLDYAGFAFCTGVVMWLLAAWAGWSGTRPAYQVLLVALIVGLHVGSRSQLPSKDRWHIDYARSAPFVWTGRIVASAVLLVTSVLVTLSLINGASFGTDHVLLLATCVGYAVLAIHFAPLAAHPRWKGGL